MNRKAFYDLLTRYIKGECTDQERQLIEQWYELLGHTAHAPVASDLDAKALLQQLWPKIKERLKRSKK